MSNKLQFTIIGLAILVSGIGAGVTANAAINAAVADNKVKLNVSEYITGARSYANINLQGGKSTTVRAISSNVQADDLQGNEGEHLNQIQGGSQENDLQPATGTLNYTLQ